MKNPKFTREIIRALSDGPLKRSTIKRKVFKENLEIDVIAFNHAMNFLIEKNALIEITDPSFKNEEKYKLNL